MFSGIIYGTGRVTAIRPGSGLKSIQIKINKNIINPEKGMSIAINGACLTASQIKNAREFTADMTEETVRTTALGKLKSGSVVNVEFPLTMDRFLSGHIVQGHVDCTGSVVSTDEKAGNRILKVSYPEEFDRNIVEKGSIAVDGISLTAYNVRNNTFEVSLIPETYSETIVKNYKKGTIVNLEFDLIGKYILKQAVQGYNIKER
jgi:riboflavin synthase